MRRRERRRWQVARGGQCKRCFIRRWERPTFAYCVKRNGQWGIVVRNGVQVVLCALCYIRMWNRATGCVIGDDN